ncbi:MAG: ABC transporter substrate-binding protein [Actinomycetota bacterium]|nr:ABC transporter substrate-binding protein [Actinomycetota bacterium]
MRNTSRVKFFAAAAVLALTAAACSDDETATTTTAGATTTAATGDTTPADTTPGDTTPGDTTGGTETTVAPVVGLPRTSGDQTAKVMVLTDVTQGQIAYSAPETYPAVQLAFADFPNVEVTVCDAKGDQNEYLNCQQSAIDSGVNAVVVGWSAGGQAGEDALYEAGIPVIGGGATVDPLSFAFSSGQGNYVGLGAGSVVAGGSKIGVLYLEGTDFLVDAIERGAKSQGGEIVSRAAVPSNAPDLAPAIAKLLGDDVDMIILSVSPPMVVQAMTAIDATGEKPLVSAVGAILPQQLLDYLGPLAEGMFAINQNLGNAEDSETMAELAAGVEGIQAGTALNVQTVLGFVSGYVLATALSNVEGDVTSEALVAQLNAVDGLDLGGMVGPVSTKPLPAAGLERFMNPYAIVYKVVDGKLVKQSELIDVRDAFAA